MSFVTDRFPKLRSTIEVTLPEIEYVKSAAVAIWRRTTSGCQTQNYLRIVQRYLRMVENFAVLHYSLLQRAPPENHCVLTQLRWPLRSNCCPAVQFDGGADRSLFDLTLWN